MQHLTIRGNSCNDVGVACRTGPAGAFCTAKTGRQIVTTTSLEMRSLLLSAAVAAAAASSPVAGFRPPSVPIFVQSPEVNVWSNSDHAYDSHNTRWTGATADLVAAAYVNGQGYLLMGQSTNPAWAPAGSNIQVRTRMVTVPLCKAPLIVPKLTGGHTHFFVNRRRRQLHRLQLLYGARRLSTSSLLAV